ncbi:MAG: chorismate mutase [Erysipelotrichaceae bacterium]|nr:chorismate mutase [Erysipelotrichaceae bacterium]
MKTLEMCRLELNEIDNRLKELFLRRMEVIGDVSAYKKANGIAIYDPERERAMKDRLSSDLQEPMKTLYLEFLDSILNASKELQSDLREK